MVGERLFKLAWIFFEKFGLIFLSMLSFYIFALLLTPAELGTGVLIVATVELVGLILTSSIEDPIVRMERLEERHISSVFWAGLLISALLLLLLVGGTALYTADLSLVWMMAVGALKVPFVTCSRPFVARLRREGNFKALASRTLLGKVLGAVVGIVCAYQGWGGWAIVAQAVVMELVSFVILMAHDRRPIPFFIDWRFLRTVMETGLPVSLKALSWSLMGRGVNIVLGMTAGAAAVGIFNLANRLIELPRSAIYNGLLSYALPVFSRRQKDLAALRAIYLNSTAITGIFMIPFFTGIALTAEDIVLLFFGDKWADSIPVLQILAVTAALANTVMYAGTALMAVGQPKLTLKAEMIASALVLGVIFLFGEQYGALAGAAGMIVRFMVVYPFNLWGLNRALGLSLGAFFRTIGPSLLAVTVMAVAVIGADEFFDMGSIKRLILAVAGGGLIYLVMYTLLHRSWIRDIRTFLGSR